MKEVLMSDTYQYGDRSKCSDTMDIQVDDGSD